MKRREFFKASAAIAAVAVCAPTSLLESRPTFPLLNFIDLPDTIMAVVPFKDRLFAFTGRAMYEIRGCGGLVDYHGRRFFAMEIDPENACVIKVME